MDARLVVANDDFVDRRLACHELDEPDNWLEIDVAMNARMPQIEVEQEYFLTRLSGESRQRESECGFAFLRKRRCYENDFRRVVDVREAKRCENRTNTFGIGRQRFGDQILMRVLVALQSLQFRNEAKCRDAECLFDLAAGSQTTVEALEEQGEKGAEHKRCCETNSAEEDRTGRARFFWRCCDRDETRIRLYDTLLFVRLFEAMQKFS